MFIVMICVVGRYYKSSNLLNLKVNMYNSRNQVPKSYYQVCNNHYDNNNTKEKCEYYQKQNALKLNELK